MQHVVAIADSLTSRSALTKALFRTSPLEADDEVINGEIATEDSFADLYGQFVCVLMSQRLRRGTWFLQGWPWRAFRCLAGGDTYRATVAELENDIAIFESLQANEDKSVSMETMLSRHVLQKISCKQLAAAVKDKAAPCFEEEFLELLRKRCRVLFPTQIVEDLNGTQKNSKTVACGRKFRRPERSMAVALKYRVLDERHRFETPPATAAMESKSIKLGANCFQPAKADRTLEWNRIVGTGEADWYSPSATNFSVNCADLALLRHASAKGDWQVLEKAWLGSICDARHHLVLCVTEKEIKHYYLALFHFADSCAVAWPVNLMPCGAGKQLVELKRSVKDIPFLPITCLKHITACKGTWRSWLYQLHHFKKDVVGMQAGVRMVLDGRFKGVRQVAAEDAGD